MTKLKNRSLAQVQNALKQDVAELKEIGLVKWVRLNPRKAVIYAAVIGAGLLFLSAVFGAGGATVPTVDELRAFDLR